MNSFPTNITFMIALSLLVLGCAEDTSETGVAEQAHPPVAEPVVTRIAGSCSTVFDGEICTWSEARGDELLSFGATVPLTFVENAPPDDPLVMPPVTHARIPLPENVRTATGVDHLGLNWEAYGHPPGTFMTPHFDFHFYTRSGTDIEAIDCSDLTKPEVLPEGYMLPDIGIPEMNMTLVGLCVPTMGMHAMREAEMHDTDLFSATMIVGYYHQDVIFIEPMISQALLQQREDFSLEVPVLANRGNGLATPAAFKAHYDPGLDAYHLTWTMQGAGSTL